MRVVRGARRLLRAVAHRKCASLAENGWVHDGLGRSLSAAGKRDGVLRNYRRSLELVPDNDNARRLWRALKRARTDPRYALEQAPSRSRCR